MMSEHKASEFIKCCAFNRPPAAVRSVNVKRPSLDRDTDSFSFFGVMLFTRSSYFSPPVLSRLSLTYTAQTTFFSKRQDSARVIRGPVSRKVDTGWFRLCLFLVFFP